MYASLYGLVIADKKISFCKLATILAVLGSLSLDLELLTIKYDLLLHETAYFFMARSNPNVTVVIDPMAVDEVIVLLHLKVDQTLMLR